MKAELDALVSEMYKGGISYSAAVQEFRKCFVAAVLKENRGNQCKAASDLGIHRNSLSRIIAELGLDVRAFRPKARRPAAAVRPLPKAKASAG